MADSYDVVVVGGGACGAAAAYHLAGMGRRVLLAEQFEIGHDRGSSHGESRIIRRSYAEADYATLAPAAFAMWRQLEQESGADLLRMTGGLDLGPAQDSALAACRRSLATAGFEHEWLEGSSAQEAVPQFNLPDDWAVLRQPGAGILHAARCVQALASQARARGAEIRDHTKVAALASGSSGVNVLLQSESGDSDVEAGAVIVAAGPWATTMLPSLGLEVPLRVTHQQVVYYPVADREPWAAERCPVYIAHGREGFYGFPEFERPGFIKVGIELDTVIEDPGELPRPAEQDALLQLNGVVGRMFLGVRPDPAEVIACRYTETPDNDFVLDRHPSMAGVVVASPCSGHGFKFAIVSGRLAAELATTATGSYDSPLWRDRFAMREGRLGAAAWPSR